MVPAGPELGKALVARNGCASCNSTGDGPGVVATDYADPSLAGLFGGVVILSDGSRVTADEDYLRESILEPDARIVKGFSSGIMPQRSGDRLSESDVDAVIQYIEAIR